MNNPLSNGEVSGFGLNTPELLWLGFFIATLIFTIHALIVIYHLFTFGTDQKVALTGTLVYLGGGALLLVSLLITITLIT